MQEIEEVSAVSDMHFLIKCIVFAVYIFNLKYIRRMCGA